MGESAAAAGQRILVVDDEPSIVDAVATALRYEGFAVDEASNGREALEAVARNAPDLVVLDWMLPDVEGVEVGRRLRQRGFSTGVRPAVASSRPRPRPTSRRSTKRSGHRSRTRTRSAS